MFVSDIKDRSKDLGMCIKSLFILVKYNVHVSDEKQYTWLLGDIKFLYHKIFLFVST